VALLFFFAYVSRRSKLCVEGAVGQSNPSVPGGGIKWRQSPIILLLPAMDSCMVGIRLYRTCALTAPDSSDPGEYGRLAHGKF